MQAKKKNHGEWLAAIQWAGFMAALGIAAPVAIAGQFHMDAHTTSEFVRRTLFVLGTSSLLQGLIGHRMPVSEGPAGLWWAVFSIYSGFIGTLYATEAQTLGILSGAMFVSGIFILILSAAGLLEPIRKLFTPTATMIYLLLLVMQLSGPMMRGMVGIADSTHTDISVSTAVLSITTVFLALYFGKARSSFARQYSVVLSLAAGWLMFYLAGLAPTPATSDNWIQLPVIFPFGSPSLDAGTMTTGIFIGLLLTTNMITSVQVMGPVVQKDADKKTLKRGGLLSGMNLLIAGVFEVVGSVPIAAAAGFVSQTGFKNLRPFLVGSLLLCLITFVPPVIHIVAAIPGAVCCAVSFAVFTRLIGLSLAELEHLERKEDLLVSYEVTGIALLTGVGCMFLPAEAVQGMPVAIAVLLNNGLVTGTVVGILVEQVLRFNRRRSA